MEVANLKAYVRCFVANSKQEPKVLVSLGLFADAKDGVGSDESRDLGECPSADCFAAHRKASPLSVGQSKSPTTELLFENAVFFLKVFDDRVLLAGDPACQ